MTFGERVKLARTKRGLTQDKLAEKAGFSGGGYVSLLEREGNEHSIKSPTLNSVKKLAEALDVSWNWLAFEGEPEPEWPTPAPASEGAGQ